eukprot:905853-Prymnesium_polylepis.2
MGETERLGRRNERRLEAGGDGVPRGQAPAKYLPMAMRSLQFGERTDTDPVQIDALLVPCFETV